LLKKTSEVSGLTVRPQSELWKDVEEKMKATAPPEAIAMPPVAKLTAKDLVGKRFMYSVSSERYATSFDASGGIQSASIINNHVWKIDKDGRLLVTQRGAGGKEVSLADEVYRTKQGIVIVGRYIIDNSAKFVIYAEELRKR
jgi:hypothetical protein